MKENQVEDESAFLQLGQQEEYEFYQFTMDQPTPSSWTHFPTRYKFLSFEMNMHRDRIKLNRQTYSLLDWLGDLGGLTDALYIIFSILVTTFSKFSF